MKGGDGIGRLLDERAEFAQSLVVHSRSIQRACQLTPFQWTRVSGKRWRGTLAADRQQEVGIQQSVQRFTDLELAQSGIADQAVDVTVSIDQRQQSFLLW